MANQYGIPEEDYESILGLSSVDDKNELLKQQVARAMALRQPNGYRHTTAAGATFGGLADIVRNIGGAIKEHGLRGEQRGLMESKQGGIDAFNRARQGLGQTDAESLFTLDEPTAQERAKAYADVLAKREALGMLGVSTGNETLGKVGGALVSGAVDQRGKIGEAGRFRLTKAMERERLEQDNWGAVPDGVTGGILTFNKKTGQLVPYRPGDAAPQTPGLRPAPGKPTEGQRNDERDARTNVAQLNLAIEKLEKSPGAYGGAGNFAMGFAEKVLPDALAPVVQAAGARTLQPGELEAKNIITNVVSAIINKRAGSNVTLSEELRQKFAPQEMDSLDVVLRKLKDLRALELTNHAAASGGTVPESSPSEQSPEALRRVETYY